MEIQHNSEQLHERLLDLTRAKELSSIREFNSSAILQTIREIGKAKSESSVIQSLLQGSQVISNWQHYAVLEKGAEHWFCADSEHTALKESIWFEQKIFQRALSGECVLLFKPAHTTEFSEQDEAVQSIAGSVLIFSLKTNLTQKLVLLFSAQKSFIVQHQEAIGEFLPIAEQKLQNLEFEQKLYEMVDQRSHELKVTQERMLDFIHVSSDWFWELDKELRFSFVATPNHPEGDIFQSMILGKTIMELRSIKEKSLLNKWFAASRQLQSHQPFENFDFELQLGARSPVWVRIKGQPIYDQEGHFSGYRGIAANITQYMHEQEQLNQQLQVLSASRRVKAAPQEVEIEAAQVKESILLVDDCKSSQMITQMMLINLGYQVTVMSSGEDALALGEELQGYKLILMDLEMPDLSGEEVSRIMRERGISVPIFVLSGCDYQERAEGAYAAGMNGFLEKPVRLNMLKEQLSSLDAGGVS